MTRIYTDEAEVQGCSGKTSGASEPDSLASELAYSPVSESLHSLRECGPAFRALSEIKKLPRIGIQKKSGARPDCWDSGFF